MDFDSWYASLARRSFSCRDLIGQDKWEPWTVDYSFTTDTDLIVTGRYRIVGRQCFFQGSIVGTSLGITAGADYVVLPVIAAGLAGIGMLNNDTTKVSVGLGPIDVANSRFYPPAQSASGDDFSFFGTYEV